MRYLFTFADISCEMNLVFRDRYQVIPRDFSHILIHKR